jgi:fido (protein-threonine AMPylation protein)
VSGDAEREARAQQREADLVQNRIGELYENPLQGNFDAEHLKAVHAYIFQDLPQHRPGVTREDAPNWTKHRGLEAQRGVHDVPYVSRDVEARMTAILEQFGGPDSLKGLTPEAAAARIAELYGNLDHVHGFYEGNSRTLREFTRALAEEAGFTLDWIKTGIGTTERNELYLARDLAVYEREFPGLTEAKAMRTGDRREYEAYFTVQALRDAVGDRTLEAIIREGLHPLK